MWEKGVSVRCMVTWGVWLLAGVVGLGGIALGNESAARVGMVLACTGMTLMVLNDNAKTRRLYWRLDQERRDHAETGAVRSMH